MTNKVKPTLYIALGNASAAIVKKNAKLLSQRNPLLQNIIADVCIDDDGQCHSIFKDEKYFKFNFVEDITQKGVFVKNYEKLLDKEDQLYDLVRRSISSVNQYDKHQPLVEKNYEIGEPQVVVFGTLHEAVSSTLITPLLKQIHNIKQEVNYLYSEVTGLFILPDLFHAIQDEKTHKVVSDYKENERVDPMLKDSTLADKGDVKYRPIAKLGKKSVVFLQGEDDGHKIDIRDIDQGTLGSCYFLGLLGGIARTQPDFIEQMIIDNLDGTYTIRFYNEDGTERNTTIDDKFWTDRNGIPIYSNVSDQDPKHIETWVMLIEKAWAKLHGGYDHIEGGNTKKIRYDIAISGNKREYLDLTETDETAFFDKIYQHFHTNKQAVVFGSKAAKEEGDDEVLEENHAYILKDISHQNKTVNLYNTHAHDHLFGIDWEYIKRHFVNVTFYTIKPHEKAISRKYKQVRELEYSRTLASVTELDAELNKSESKGVSLMNYTFVVGNKNRKNITLGDFKDMLISLSEFSLMLVNDGFATTNLGIQMGEDIDGKRNRYSSFGYSTLLYPEKKFIKGLKEVGQSEIFGEMQSEFRNQKFSASTIGAEVNAFLDEHKFNQYFDRIQLDEDGGKPIFENFVFNGERSQDVPLQNFLTSLDKQAEQYESQVFNKTVVPKIEKRKNALTQKLLTDIDTRVNKEVDIPKRGINYAHAFTATLLREDCDSIDGEIIDEVNDLRKIESKVLEFYQSQTDLPQLVESNQDQFKLLRNKERLFRKLTNDIQRLEEKSEAEQDGQAQSDTSNLMVEINSKKEERHKLANAIDTLKSDFEKGKEKVEDLKRELESPEYRKSLREKDIANQQDKIDEHLQIVTAHEQKRNQHLAYLEELKNRKDKLLKKLLLILPALIFGIPALIFMGIEIFEKEIINNILRLAESSRLEFYIEILLIGLIAYGIWAFLRYRKRVGKELKAANETLKELDATKVKLYNEHATKRGELYKSRYDHILSAGAYQGIEDLIQLTDKNKQQLGGFKKEVFDTFNESEEAIDELYFEKNLFQNTIITKDDIDRLKVPMSLQKFIRDKEERNLVAYYKDYQKSGSLDRLESDSEEYLGEMYRNLERKSLMDFVYRDEKLKEEISPATRVKLLKDASEVYINLKDYGTSDQTEEASNLYCDNFEDSDAQQTQQLVLSAGLNAQSKYSTGDKNNIALFRVLKGFPAFQITLMDECRSIMDSIASRDQDWKKKDFFINPEYAKENIFPSTLILGSAADEVRVAFAQACALGIVEKDTNYWFNGFDLGKTIEDSIKFLKSLKGEPYKDKLIRKVEDTLNNIKTVDQQKEALNKVNNYVQVNPQLDAVDQKILDTLIRSLV